MREAYKAEFPLPLSPPGLMKRACAQLLHHQMNLYMASPSPHLTSPPSLGALGTIALLANGGTSFL